MFSNTFRSYVGFAKYVYSNVFAYSTQYKCIKSHVIHSVRNRCIENYVLITRYYSVVNKSVEVTTAYNKKYEEKLEELLKDPEYQELYQKLKLEVEYARHTYFNVPTKLRPCDWLILLSTKSKTQRRSYLNFRFINEKRDENRLKYKELQKDQRSSTQLIKTDDPLDYGLFKNTMFLRLYEPKILQYYNNRLIHAMMYEPTIVFDLEYDKYMTLYEMQNCAKQLIMAFSHNRLHKNPFNLHFCNVNRSSYLMQRIHTVIPTLYEAHFPLNITSKSYLDIFDRKKLVYLTPHTHITLDKYDPDMTYIIGAMVDKVDPKPLSSMKAKQEGIKVAKLPLNEYLDWGCGSGKNLPINQVLSILLDIRHTNDWNVALQHVPARKLKASRHMQLTQNMEHRNKILESLRMKKNLS